MCQGWIVEAFKPDADTEGTIKTDLRKVFAAVVGIFGAGWWRSVHGGVGTYKHVFKEVFMRLLVKRHVVFFFLFRLCLILWNDVVGNAVLCREISRRLNFEFHLSATSDAILR